MFEALFFEKSSHTSLLSVSMIFSVNETSPENFLIKISCKMFRPVFGKSSTNTGRSAVPVKITLSVIARRLSFTSSREKAEAAV